MSRFPAGSVRGTIGFLFLIFNTFFWMFPVFAAAVFKFIIPVKKIRDFFDIILNRLCHTWMYCNNRFLRKFKEMEYHVQGLDELELNEWYLVVANHQTWVDIIVLHDILHGRIPFLKYFLKKELIWVPVLGIVWWALDYPFMKRYPSLLIKKKPHLKGKDVEATRKACEKFKYHPASIMNFVEGTRFTSAKHEAQGSPYKYLLKPRSGGISYVLSAMGDQVGKLIDITIVYPDGAEGTWDFLCSRKSRIVVLVEVLLIDDSLKGEDPDNPDYRSRFNDWLNSLWERKDKKIEQILQEFTPVN